MTANNDDVLKSSFETWHEFTRTYTDLMFDAVQRSMDQTLALRERADRMWADTVKTAEALTTQEQEIILGAVESLQAQTRSATERVARLFETFSSN